MTSSAIAATPLIRDRMEGCLYGMLVGDALAMPVHWFYSPTKLRNDYGEVTELMAPLPHHAESMVQGMSYGGSIDIMHDKAHLYEGYAAAENSNTRLTKEEMAARRDDHGNFVGVVADERVHYHQSLKKGQNTANMCIARLLMRYLGETNVGKQDYYDTDEFLERLVQYMTTPPDAERDIDQVQAHNDTYLDIYLRNFFKNASKGIALRNCAMTQRDQWSIGSLDGVAMSIPIVVAYANEPEAMVTGRAVEHHMLTHRSITVTMVVTVLVPLLLELFRGADLKQALDRAMDKLRPPKCTGRQQRDSYIENRGPHNILKHEKWLQHMLTTDESTRDFIHRMVAEHENDEDVCGWGDRPNSRLSGACYCEQAFHVVLYLAYKYGEDDPKKALLQNAMLGGHSTSRGAVLGAILGAAHETSGIPFVDDLAARDVICKEVGALVETV